MIDIKSDDFHKFLEAVKLRKFENIVETLPVEIKHDLIETRHEKGFSFVSIKFIKALQEILSPEEIILVLDELYSYSNRKETLVLKENILLILADLDSKIYKKLLVKTVSRAIQNDYSDIRELAVYCFEQWDNPFLLKYLRLGKFIEPWLKNYSQEVIIECYQEWFEKIAKEKFSEEYATYDY